jgi:hypothetical protein
MHEPTEKTTEAPTTANEAAPASKIRASTNSASSRRLSDAQFGEALEMLDDVDSVELKITVPVDDHRTTIRGLPIDPVEAEPRQAFFFDTRKLALNEAGIVARARRFQGGAGDTVIKVRPVVPSEIPRNMRRSGACKVELDAMPGRFVCSASFKGGCTGEEVREAVEGEMPLSKLFSKEQRAFYRKFAPKSPDLDKLVVLGPTFLLRSRFYVKRLDRNVTAEYWLYPETAPILELSVKAAPREAFQVRSAFLSYLAKHEIDTRSDQQAKTGTALAFFSARLNGAAVRSKRRRSR